MVRELGRRPAPPPAGMAGHAWAYRIGGCCPHPRHRHHNTMPMTCTGVLRAGDTRPDGTTVATAETCGCTGWKEEGM